MASLLLDESSDSGSEFSGFDSDDLPSDLDASILSSEESDEEVEVRDNWVQNDRRPRRKQPFSGPEPGPTIDLGPEAREVDFFMLFFPVNLLLSLVEQTNLFARQKQIQKPDPHWVDTTVEELKAWLGIRVYMSIMQVCNLNKTQNKAIIVL